jgi:hypothetical protein
MSVPARLAAAFIALLLLVFGGSALFHYGLYGWTLFAAMPILLGAVGVGIADPSTHRGAVGIGMLSVLIALSCLMLIGTEGLICIFMAVPIAVPLGALGGWLMFRARRSVLAGRGVAMLLLLPPGSVAWDVTAQPPVFQVRSAVEVAASPEQVWKHVVTFSELAEPREWFFRAGLAYPIRARIQGSGPGAVRYCEFSTGPFVEPIEVWNEPTLLRFRITENPAPMHEWSPYANVLPKHLHGYLVSEQGQFRLTPLPGGRTLLEGTTWYRHGLWPAEYWRWWSDAIIHRIHLRVLRHIRTLAEAENAN